MTTLGFGESGYVAQGGDIGSRIARFLGANYDECKAVHCMSRLIVCSFVKMVGSEGLQRDTNSVVL
jgi:hypothetical protein